MGETRAAPALRATPRTHVRTHALTPAQASTPPPRGMAPCCASAAAPRARSTCTSCSPRRKGGTSSRWCSSCRWTRSTSSCCCSRWCVRTHARVTLFSRRVPGVSFFVVNTRSRVVASGCAASAVPSASGVNLPAGAESAFYLRRWHVCVRAMCGTIRMPRSPERRRRALRRSPPPPEGAAAAAVAVEV